MGWIASLSVAGIGMALATVIAIVAVILLLYFMLSNRESFDTYHNHDFGAYEVYKREQPDVIPRDEPGYKQVEAAARYALYTRREKDPKGLTVYDKYYEQLIKDKYNSGFANDLYPSASVLTSMMDNDPITTVVNGEVITLSQKNY